MAIRKIARLGHPVLRQRAETVTVGEITSPAIQSLIQDMFDTVEDADGAGLAAPQIYESKRIALVDLDDEHGFQVWINPTITPLTEEQNITFEGCLSVPNMRGAVARYSKIQVDALNELGKSISMALEGYPATVAQHECDHLDGIVYVDRVEPETLSFLEEYNRFGDLFFDELSEEE